MKKLTLEMNPEAARRMARLQNALPNAPKDVAYVFRVACRLLESSLRVQKAGGEVIFKNKDGSEKTVLFGEE